MPRIQPVNPEQADAKTTELLKAVKSKMGKVPNLISTMAQSPAVANAYLGLSQSLGSGSLPPQLRDQIALVVGEPNSCQYCVSAHSALGRGAGLTEESVIAARKASASQAKENTALTFAKKLVDNRGHVTDEELSKLREAGYSDGDICEIVAHVAMNIFTNYFNHVAETEIDFPVAPALAG